MYVCFMSYITYVYTDDDQFKRVKTFRFIEHFKNLVVSTVSYITISYVRHLVHTASSARSVSIPVGKTVIFPNSRACCSKGKAVPLQAWTGPEGSRKLRFPDFVTTAQDGGRLSALRTGHLYLQEILLVLTSVRG